MNMRSLSPAGNMSILVCAAGSTMLMTSSAMSHHRPAPVAQRRGDESAVGAYRVMMFLRPMNFGGGRRADSIGATDRDQPRGKMRDRHRDRDLGQENADVGLLAEHQRQEHDDAGHRACGDRDADNLRALHGAIPRLVGKTLAIVIDALDDDDRIVDEHADRQQQTHHRQDVQSHAEHLQAAERDHEADRNRQRHHQCRRHVAQEKEQYKDREQRSFETSPLS